MREGYVATASETSCLLAFVPSISEAVSEESIVPAVVRTLVSLIVTPEFLMSLPVVALNLAIALSVADTGQTTSPPHAGVDHLNHVACVESAIRDCPSVPTHSLASTVL